MKSCIIFGLLLLSCFAEPTMIESSEECYACNQDAKKKVCSTINAYCCDLVADKDAGECQCEKSFGLGNLHACPSHESCGNREFFLVNKKAQSFSITGTTENVMCIYDLHPEIDVDWGT